MTNQVSPSVIPNSDAVKVAIIDILPFSIATFPWGILCGSLGIEVGLSSIETQAMSLFVFAGAAQLATLGIVGTSGFAPSTLSSTFIISSRHLLYSAAFREDVKKLKTGWRVAIAFFLTDEMFATSSRYNVVNGYFCKYYALASGITFYLFWNASTLVGIYIGQSIPNLNNFGFEFAIAATFISIVIPSITSIPILVSVLVTLTSCVLFEQLSSTSSLLPSTILGMFSGYLASRMLNE